MKYKGCAVCVIKSLHKSKRNGYVTQVPAILHHIDKMLNASVDFKKKRKKKTKIYNDNSLPRNNFSS